MDIKFKNKESFVVSAVEFYRQKTVCKEWGFSSHREDVIEWLYKLGRDYNVLSMDYTEFKLILHRSHKHYYSYGRAYLKSPIRYYGRYSHHCDIKWYRVARRFTYNDQAKKDSPSKKDWWKYKGIIKDRRKTRWHNGWKRDLKFFCKRKHRQLERETIKNERYDRLHRLTYKQSEDPWSWD